MVRRRSPVRSRPSAPMKKAYPVMGVLERTYFDVSQIELRIV